MPPWRSICAASPIASWGSRARAIADLGAAIWLGLPAPDKVKAQVNRGLAYKSAGLTREGDAELAAARKGRRQRRSADRRRRRRATQAGRDRRFLDRGPAGGPGRVEQAARVGRVRNEPAAPPTRTANASPGAWSTSRRRRAAAERASSGNRLTRWFGSVTGSSSAPAPPPEPAPPPPKQQRRRRPQADGAPAIGGRGKLELVDHHRRARGAGERRREQEPLVAPVQPRQPRPSRRRNRPPPRQPRRRRLPAAARHQPIGRRGEGAVEEGLGERRRRSAADRESRYRQFRHLLEPAHRTLPGQGGKP